MTPDEKIEDPQTEIGQLSDHLREYIGIRRELFELKLWDKLFGTASTAITWAVIVFLGVICIFLLSAAAAFAIGSALGRTWLGFLIVAGGYGLIATILLIGRQALLQKPLQDRFIDNLVNEEEEEEEEETMSAIERITSRKQLKARISYLTQQMDAKEEQLKADLKEVHQSLRAANMIRNAIKDIRDQPDLRFGLAQAAADMGAHALIDRVVFRKNRGLKNYILSILLKRIADHFILKERKKTATS